MGTRDATDQDTEHNSRVSPEQEARRRGGVVVVAAGQADSAGGKERVRGR